VGDDDEVVDPGRRDGPDGAQEDWIAGEADELLRHVRAEPVPIAAGQDDRMKSHGLLFAPGRHSLVARQYDVDPIGVSTHRPGAT
jgi:hypothetical protein